MVAFRSFTPCNRMRSRGRHGISGTIPVPPRQDITVKARAQRLGKADHNTGLAGHDIIVVGASAGGSLALVQLAKQLPQDLHASVFVVYHMPPDARGSLVQALQSATTIRTKIAEDLEEIKHGVVYVAPPDRHLLVKRGHIRVIRGPRKNRWRPAIDPLFVSAAVAYGSRVIGVVLTGMLNDGTAGLLAVKKCGGIAMIQDPLDAAHPEMPQSAWAKVDIDHRLPLSEMGAVIVRLVSEAAGVSPRVPREFKEEARFVEESPDNGTL